MCRPIRRHPGNPFRPPRHRPCHRCDRRRRTRHRRRPCGRPLDQRRHRWRARPPGHPGGRPSRSWRPGNRPSGSRPPRMELRATGVGRAAAGWVLGRVGRPGRGGAGGRLAGRGMGRHAAATATRRDPDRSSGLPGAAGTATPAARGSLSPLRCHQRRGPAVLRQVRFRAEGTDAARRRCCPPQPPSEQVPWWRSWFRPGDNTLSSGSGGPTDTACRAGSG